VGSEQWSPAVGPGEPKTFRGRPGAPRVFPARKHGWDTRLMRRALEKRARGSVRGEKKGHLRLRPESRLSRCPFPSMAALIGDQGLRGRMSQQRARHPFGLAAREPPVGSVANRQLRSDRGRNGRPNHGQRARSGSLTAEWRGLRLRPRVASPRIVPVRGQCPPTETSSAQKASGRATHRFRSAARSA